MNAHKLNDRFVVALGGRQVFWEGLEPLKLQVNAWESVALKRAPGGLLLKTGSFVHAVNHKRLAGDEAVEVTLPLASGATLLSVRRAAALRPAYLADATGLLR